LVELDDSLAVSSLVKESADSYQQLIRAVRL